MLQADKNTLEWELAKGKVAAATAELDFHIERLRTLMTQATLVAGFAFTGLGAESMGEVSTPQIDVHSLLPEMFVMLSTASMALSLWVICVAQYSTLKARNLALEGPFGSVEIAAALLEQKSSLVFYAFSASLGFLVLAATLLTWAYRGIGLTSIIVTVIFLMTFSHLVYEMRDVSTKFAPKGAGYKEQQPLQRAPARYRRLASHVHKSHTGMRQDHRLFRSPSSGSGNEGSGPFSAACPPAGAAGPTKPAAAGLGGMPMPEGRSPPKAKVGWLEKAGGKAGILRMQRFARRYFELREGMLIWYASNEDMTLNLPCPSCSAGPLSLTDFEEPRMREDGFTICLTPRPRATHGGASSGIVEPILLRPVRSGDLRAANTWLQMLRAHHEFYTESARVTFASPMQRVAHRLACTPGLMRPTDGLPGRRHTLQVQYSSEPHKPRTPAHARWDIVRVAFGLARSTTHPSPEHIAIEARGRQLKRAASEASLVSSADATSFRGATQMAQGRNAALTFRDCAANDAAPVAPGTAGHLNRLSGGWAATLH